MPQYKTIMFNVQYPKRSWGHTELGNYLCKQVELQLPQEEVEVLLSYPVVYVHSWNDNGVRHIYVGETIDMTRRTVEHEQQSANAWNWHGAWQTALQTGGARSVFIGGRDMNKSLAQDVEHALILMVQQAAASSDGTISSANGNTGKAPPEYNNQNDAAFFVQRMWTELQQKRILSTQGDWWSWFSGKAGLTRHALSVHRGFFAAMKTTLNPPAQFGNCPLIYIHLWKDGKQLRSYVGETDDLAARTQQHYNNVTGLKLTMVDGNWIDNVDWRGHKNDWREAVRNGTAQMLVFGGTELNRSMTLDLENQLIQYTIACGTAVNGRTNEQGAYSGKDRVHGCLQKIVEKLHAWYPASFLTLDEVAKKSVFMASPLFALTQAQANAKQRIKAAAINAFSNGARSSALIEIGGTAGTGKTVLLSSLFFDLLTTTVTDSSGAQRPLDCRLIVNHKGLYKLYQLMEAQWSLNAPNTAVGQRIWKAQEFINDKVTTDMLLVDEGHLLFTQGKFGSIPEAQLPRLAKQAKVVILVYDPLQCLQKQAQSQAMLRQSFRQLMSIKLSIQMRMHCAHSTQDWLRWLCTHPSKSQMPQLYGSCSSGNGYVRLVDREGYELRVYGNQDPGAIARDIQEKRETAPLSALLATYSWSKNKEVFLKGYHWRNSDNEEPRPNKWGPTEVGSVHNIQGFDLSYAGVVLGKSVQYDGKKKALLFVKNKSGKLLHKGGLPSDPDVAAELIANEVGVLLTRGEKGLYLYACDDALRNLLINALKYAHP